MFEVSIESISRDIANYVRSKVRDIEHDEQVWKEHYNEVVRSLEAEIVTVKQAIVDYSDDNLTVARIEMEGYLRGLITMTNQFEKNRPSV